ncbi:glycogen debranching protein [Rhizobium lentis]|uniref:glycogen debranching protein n=1 Tax=Rhizobium lentis TaxID=1138194 RepID=UPI001A911274|nr:glycogen debranching protein [Rhizobium lentis]MBX5009986.1 glycogen debranching protein [Rhizobium lentis]MBX5065497.1 glycogen debranching protein [Rhizobium lentis]MBX5077699.1 glycogen debranching protein [Rhizobium lentis]MBX5102128.1 glycogen debranching protein [Rhizobium lentis]QSW92720.1 glycogen debranching protein [Rhizobium lentis]
MIKPSKDGQLSADAGVLLPIMAPRLQADVHPDGYADVALWGAGSLGRVRFSPIAGPYIYAPNRLVSKQGGVYVAQSRPVMLIGGVNLQGIYPARRCAWWHAPEGRSARAKVSRSDHRRIFEMDWGVLIVEALDSGLRIAGGASQDEAEKALDLTNEAIIAEAADYVTRCDMMPEADSLMRSMVSQGIHAALSSIRRDENGAFAGLAAGQAYSAPARTYYRDGYWTMQPLLTLAPEAVREEIRLLAKGVQPDGEAPSGVILTGPAQSDAWQRFVADCKANPKTHKRAVPEYHNRPQDWWSDHFDSPLFFILFLSDYVDATADSAEVQLHWPTVKGITDRYLRLAGPDSVLPLKPRNDRDWADNVYREGLVSYDLGLFVGAMDAVARLGENLDPALARRARETADLARAEIEAKLFVPATGGYLDYGTSGAFVEDHLALDSLTLSRFRAISEQKAVGLLRAFETRLETRHNQEQPYGSWGVMCAYPPFKRQGDLRSKTAFPYRYHNCSDWPYWDGVYAEERLRLGLGGARYALIRWWETCLDNGWIGAVEYFSPPYGRGSLLQGWSAMPAAVALKYGFDAANSEPMS